MIPPAQDSYLFSAFFVFSMYDKSPGISIIYCGPKLRFLGFNNYMSFVSARIPESSRIPESQKRGENSH